MDNHNLCLVVEFRELDSALTKIMDSLNIDLVLRRDYSGALDFIRSSHFNYLITNHILPRSENAKVEPLGLDLIKYVRTRHRNNLVPVAMLSTDNTFTSDPSMKCLLDNLRSLFIFKDLSFRRRSLIYNEFFNKSFVEVLDNNFLIDIKKDFPDNDVKEILLLSHEIFFASLNCEKNDEDHNKGFIIESFTKLHNIISSSEGIQNVVSKDQLLRCIDNFIKSEHIDRSSINEFLKMLGLSINCNIRSV